MRVAVASSDGRLINQHFGHAERFLIFDADESGIRLAEDRKAGKYCSDDPDHLYDPKRTEKIYDVLKDCSILLVSRIGTRPQKELEKKGIKVIMVYDRIEEGIKRVVAGFMPA